MTITYDIAKRDETLADRGLDFAHAEAVCAGRTLTHADVRLDYGEASFVTAGRLRGRIVMVVWTPRGTARRIISMRQANEREIKEFGPILG
ncbi:hypothetical protein AWB67_05663 [Caballeronia terrestris]|uniref:BrnT family toxin n=1 Tax=Caballeronia terrestris TaxID=1226301 RepID=A0A158KI02_9BURK|nr:BrnT family toxin [Caballeronia terrestris]SAL80645.1 hypothetical protein AWB67_05663 [Caballeronia terrestris]